MKFSAEASVKEMGKDDYVQIQFVVENAKQIENLQTPDFSDFTIIQGPNESTGMSVVNGAMSQYKGISFILRPKKTGTLNIKPASALVDGQLKYTHAIQIVVKNQSSLGNSNPQGFSPLPDPDWPTAQPEVEMDELVRPGDHVAEKIRKNFFLKVEVSKTDCHLGEVIVATYKLYSRLRSESRVTKHPSLNGFSVFDMVDPGDDRITVEKVNGRNYNVHTIRKTQLIPLQAGDIVLDPVELDNNIYLIRTDAAPGKNQGIGGILDRIFQPEVRGTPFTEHTVIESKPVTIHVKPLPEVGKPADFNGAVGKYTIKASVDSKEVDTGDAAILTVVIQGSGNLPVINAPVIEWPAEMESFDVSSKENINKAYAPLSGSKSFAYSFICTKPGHYILPPVKMSYFEPAGHAYHTIQSDPIQIEVKSVQKIHHVSVTEAKEHVTSTDWIKYLWFAIGIILIAGLIWLVYNQQSQFKKRELEKAKQLAAKMEANNKVIIPDPLRESRELMGAGNFGKFYASVNRAIWKAISEKLQLPASELNKLKIASGLSSKGWDESSILKLNTVLNECEMKLYTPEYNTMDMHRMLSSAEEIFLNFKA